ncbi:MAG: 2OG-Fe(II) oxygenase [Legionellales bacterium]|nr:2OG-Fe(II) oxygenase [Legionellales bacterium]|tara:strand:- start:4218 stop:5024 length:807 start_codon:yes stop_codon:yes gene_type:complete
MIDFKEKQELSLSEKFKKKGYLIYQTDNLESLNYLREVIVKNICKICKLKKPTRNYYDEFLNSFHKKIKLKDLNNIRLKLINELNKDKNYRKNYFLTSKKILYKLVGNELSMQNRINLSIQLPKDKSSLLPLHSDIWSGDSPFEVVIWIPLVNCYQTKTMYLLPPKYYKKIERNFTKYSGNSSEVFFNKIKKNVEWIKINFGEILIFNQALPHGNIVNNEKETRWSMNCRFKSIFSPYGDKKIGEFFEPITLRVASELAIKYKLPNIK